MQKAQIKILSVYGVERIYPVNETAKLLTRLTGNKCFNREDINVCKQLGVQFEVVSPATV